MVLLVQFCLFIVVLEFLTVFICRLFVTIVHLGLRLLRWVRGLMTQDQCHDQRPWDERDTHMADRTDNVSTECSEVCSAHCDTSVERSLAVAFMMGDD